MIAFDTNILAYVEGIGAPEKCALARDLIEVIPAERVILPIQVLGELYRVLAGKAKWPSTKARQSVLQWSLLYPLKMTTPTAMRVALDLAADHQFQIWDALILSVCVESGCRFLVTEDLQNGFQWRGTMVVNPFDHSSAASVAQVVASGLQAFD